MAVSKNGFTNKSDSCNYNVSSFVTMYLFYSPGGTPVNIQSQEDLDFAYSNNYTVIAYTDALQQTHLMVVTLEQDCLCIMDQHYKHLEHQD